MRRAIHRPTERIASPHRVRALRRQDDLPSLARGGDSVTLGGVLETEAVGDHDLGAQPSVCR